MVLIAAAVCTKAGKTIISRQFVEMTKARIEGLLAAFPKLMSSGMISVRSSWWRAPDPIATNDSRALIQLGSSSPRTLEWWIKLDIPTLLATRRRRLNQNVRLCSKKWVSFLSRSKLFDQIIVKFDL